MFGKLKNKLKEKLSFLSKKTEEEAEVQEEIVETIIEEKEEEKSVKEDKKETQKKQPKEKEIQKEEKTDEEFVDKIISEPTKKKEETQKETEKKDIPQEVKEEKESEELDLNKELKEEVKEIEKEVETLKQGTEYLRKKADTLVQEVKEEEPKKKGFFSKIKQVVTTKKISSEKFDDLFWELELILLENNVAVEVIEKIKNNLKEELVNKSLPRNILAKIEEVLKDTLTEILNQESIDILKEIKSSKKPYVIAFFGINGAGKTTSIAKFANYLKENNVTCVLAACDTFRAAAIQQIEEHANKLNIKLIKHDYGSDAAAVAFDAIKYAEKNNIEVVLIDTAGRLHSNINLMSELEKIIRVTKPNLKLFVGESITGNDCIEQAKKFNEMVGIEGAILTKADVDEKGGAPLSISYTIKKPILFLGVGQEYKDFEKFNAQNMLKHLGF